MLRTSSTTMSLVLVTRLPRRTPPFQRRPRSLVCSCSRAHLNEAQSLHIARGFKAYVALLPLTDPSPTMTEVWYGYFLELMYARVRAHVANQRRPPGCATGRRCKQRSDRVNRRTTGHSDVPVPHHESRPFSAPLAPFSVRRAARTLGQHRPPQQTHAKLIATLPRHAYRTDHENSI